MCPELGGLGDASWIVCVCEPFVLQTREGCGRRGGFLLSQTLQRQAGLQLWDPLISGTSGTQTHTAAQRSSPNRGAVDP